MSWQESEKYFQKMLKKLEYRLLDAVRRGHEPEVLGIRKKIEHFKAAVLALRIAGEINRPDGWEG